MIQYRKIKSEDTKNFFQLMSKLDEETDYMLYLPHERKEDLPKLAQLIDNMQKDGLLLGAENEAGQLVGYLLAERTTLSKVRHSAYIVVGIQQEYQGKGIGTKLFSYLEEWAKANQLRRLELTVMVPNERAIHLYEKAGFVKEGIKKNSIFMDERFVDEYYMAKLL